MLTFESLIPYTFTPIHNVEDILIQQSMIHAGLMIQTMTALISLVIISFYVTGLKLKLFHEFHFVFFNNKRSIGHMAHLRYSSSQYKNLRKAMIIPSVA